MNAPLVIRDKLMLRYYATPKAGVWNRDPDLAIAWTDYSAAQAKLGNLKANMQRCDRWRLELVPLAEVAPVYPLPFPAPSADNRSHPCPI